MEQILDVLGPQMGEQLMGVPNFVSRSTIQQRTHQCLSFLDEKIEVIKFDLQKRVQGPTVEHAAVSHSQRLGRW